MIKLYNSINKLAVLVALLLLTFVSCQEAVVETETIQAPLEDTLIEEIEVINTFDLAIDEEIVRNIQDLVDAKAERTHITIYDGELETVLDNGIVFRGLEKDIAYEAFDTFSDEVRTEGNYMFLTSIDYDKDWNSFFDVAILPCDNQFDLIKLLNTEGIDQDISNDEILEQMRTWDKEIGFNLVYCDNTGIDAYMENMPTDLNKFAKEVDSFCPYIIAEDAGTVEAYIEELKEDKYFYLWWGLSFKHESF
ncbi:MAG: hypothetical protein ACI857_002244 [Arenicella sp.]|jgi:hypothetical protein